MEKKLYFINECLLNDFEDMDMNNEEWIATSIKQGFDFTLESFEFAFNNGTYFSNDYYLRIL